MFELLIRTGYKSPCAHVKCIYCEINKLKDYSFTLIAKKRQRENCSNMKPKIEKISKRKKERKKENRTGLRPLNNLFAGSHIAR